MCGIAGSFHKAEQKEQAVRLEGAVGKMSHRGPDDSGVEDFETPSGHLGLAQTRLSIIDLSPGGHQPMHSADGRYVIVFNGEIYNYRELREELEEAGMSFKTDSDTEVLLASWEYWKDACLQKFRGMFAFAIWDKQEETLTCVRDAFGIKPFYYYADSELFVFA
jgi:asparagine synthase (glutamine-hydrolysing)